MCQKIGIYDYEARRDAGKLTDQETAKLYEPLSVEETAYRRTLLESYGLSILEDIEQMANERYFREEEASVLNRSRQADEQMFDTLRELGVHGMSHELAYPADSVRMSLGDTRTDQPRQAQGLVVQCKIDQQRP